jgi:hypothetical protein
MTARILVLTAIGAAVLALGGCAMGDLPPPQASLDNIQALRGAQIDSMAVGAFTPGPGRPSEMDRSVTVRAGNQAAPGGSFARYLGDTIGAELKGAGRLDPNATLVVSGVVTDTHVDSAMPTAHAALAAHFTLIRGGRVVFDKTLSVDSSWDSNFIGAVAIPDALNHYTGLYPALAAKLFADPDFVAAAHAR